MFSEFFIEWPIFAGLSPSSPSCWVSSIRDCRSRNIRHHPATIYVIISYPGASAADRRQHRRHPEEQVNGVPGMLDMQSYSASDGTYTLIVTFEVGTDMDIAQTLVYQRVAIAYAELPPAGLRAGRHGQAAVDERALVRQSDLAHGRR